MVVPAPGVHQLPVVGRVATHPVEIHVGDAGPGEEDLGGGEVVVAVAPPLGQGRIGRGDPAGFVAVAHIADAGADIVVDGPGLVILAHARVGDLGEDLVGQGIEPVADGHGAAVILAGLRLRVLGGGGGTPRVRGLGRGLAGLLLGGRGAGVGLPRRHRDGDGDGGLIPAAVPGGVGHGVYPRDGQVHPAAVNGQLRGDAAVVGDGHAPPVGDGPPCLHLQVPRPQNHRGLLVGGGRGRRGHVRAPRGTPGQQGQADQQQPARGKPPEPLWASMAPASLFFFHNPSAPFYVK